MGSSFLDMHCTAFHGDRIVASGTLELVVSQVKEVIDECELSQTLIFKDATGEQIEIDFRGSIADVRKRLAVHPDAEGSLPNRNSEKHRRVGRPKLGVVAGEVTLLPRHWEWLKSQPGGASVTLRKIIDEARHIHEKQDEVRKAQETTYRFMAVMAGNKPHYEEALRALYAGDSLRFYELINNWTEDIRNHIKQLSANAFRNIRQTIK
jgi:uncharacterized protein